MEWLLEEEGFSEEKIASDGSRFLIGNGYMGVRGTLEEYGKDCLPAINLAGIYDKVKEGWREPLNAPNVCYSYLKVDDVVYALPEQPAESHIMSLDFRHGIFCRKTSWKTKRGTVTLETERFVSLKQVHLLAMQVRVTADFHADVEFFTGIDGDVWDIHGPHYKKLEIEETKDFIGITGIAQEREDEVYAISEVKAEFPSERMREQREKKILDRLCFVTEKNQVYLITKGAVIYTSKDDKAYREQAAKLLSQYEKKGYDQVKAEHMAVWEEKWQSSEITIEGDEEAMQAMNYSIYHLHSIAPRHSDSRSIAARGLSGQTYKGAVFWDTEMFMLDFFLNTEPAVAKSLMKYRIDTLAGAQKKAKEYGFDGAFYAWESQEGGFDACTDYNVTDVFTGRPMRTYFRDKQVHISAAVVYGIMRYTEKTGDNSLLLEGGAKVVLECAKFYYSMLLKKVDSDVYELHDVIGPDEYHERINNNGYTNRMAKLTFDTAVWVLAEMEAFLAEYPVGQLREKFQDASKHLYLQQPNGEGIIQQFDGYFQLEDVSLSQVRGRLLHEKEYWGGAYGVASHTQIIKQADVIMLLNLFSGEYSEEILKKNWEYYESRTEHGSSLSACMYAILACKYHRSDLAYSFFRKSSAADLKGGGKEWAGLVYIGGSHPAAAGGTYMTVVNGFAGLEIENDIIKLTSNLPEHWKSLRFRIQYKGKRYQAEVTQDHVSLTVI